LRAGIIADDYAVVGESADLHVADSTARHWRALVFLGSVFLSERLRHAANHSDAAGVSVKVLGCSRDAAPHLARIFHRKVGAGQGGCFGRGEGSFGQFGGDACTEGSSFASRRWRMTRQSCWCEQGGTVALQTGCIGAGGAAPPP